MMLVPALLLQAAAPAQAAPDADITVIGNKLRKLQLGLAMDDGKLTGCTVKVSSGDRFIDDVACASARTCVGSGVVESSQLLGCINQRIVIAVAQQRAKDREG